MPHADVNGFRMYYEVHGEGEPVVCATGWGTMTGEGFGRLPANLRARYRLVVYDHRGIGQSTDTDVPGSTRLYADDVAGLMEHLGLRAAHILGRGGLGACIMQELAINHPEFVHDLVLSAGWARQDPYHEAADELFYILRDRVGFEAFQLYGAVICYLPEYFNEHRERILGPNGGWSEVRDRKEAHLKLIRATIEHEAAARLERITAPTLLIHAENDQLGGPRLGRELRALIPNAELEILEGAPHVVATVPAAHERFGQLTADFFARHPLVEQERP